MPIYQVKPTKDGRSYIFSVYKKDFEGNNKKYNSKRYKTSKEAKEEERLFLMKKNNPLRKEFTLVAKDYFKELYNIRKESTVYSYENAYKKNIFPFFKKCYINDIEVNTINNWKKELEKKGFKISYLNKIYNILKGIFDYAMANYGLDSNPVTIAKRFQQKNEDVLKDEDKIRYITFEQFNKFIEIIDDTMWKTFFIFLFYTGMRKGEVQALTWNDINFEEDIIIVNKTLSVKTKEKKGFKITSTKNNINRKIKLNNILKEQLLSYKNEMEKYVDFKQEWFVFGGTKFLPQTTIDNKKHQFFLKSGLKDNEITIHEFRHSNVSLLINEYVKQCKKNNMKVDTYKFFLMMSKRMGHTIEVMQKTYLHLFPTIQDDIVDILNNL